MAKRSGRDFLTPNPVGDVVGGMAKKKAKEDKTVAVEVIEEPIPPPETVAVEVVKEPSPPPKTVSREVIKKPAPPPKITAARTLKGDKGDKSPKGDTGDKRVYVYIDRDLHRRAKAQAILEEKSLSAVVAELLTAYVGDST